MNTKYAEVRENEIIGNCREAVCCKEILPAFSGANQKNQGVLEGSKYVVTWALGHLVTLADTGRI